MSATSESVDVVVVGAGIGGLYAVQRFLADGLSVLGLESADGVGGVWRHNRYPGARVDIESCEYCYHFSPELYAQWPWTERYAAQPELLAYLDHVADRFDLRRHILFETRLDRARWVPGEARYHLESSDGGRIACRFLVMATGNLSAARTPDFPGLEDFQGEWVQTSHWPDRPVSLAGRRIAVVGTGSSGVQTIPVAAEQAEHLYVFQRSPNYSVPAHNGPADAAQHDAIAADLAGRRAALLTTRAGTASGLPLLRRYAEYDETERRERLDRFWAFGGQSMNRIFADQNTDQAVNDVVADYVRGKIRGIVRDPAVADLLCPTDHPIGSRRLCIDSHYYATYNRPNVTLVDIGGDPIERITATGIRAGGIDYPVDLIIFAIGFHAFRGAVERIDIRNEKGETPTGRWDRGPRTMMGLMVEGFPNFFLLTGPGSPSVLSNMVLMNEEHVDWVAGLIGHMAAAGQTTVEPEAQAIAAWSDTVAEAARPLLRLGVENYMVHANDDGSRVFMPYVGGFDAYAEISREVAAQGYPGFRFS